MIALMGTYTVTLRLQYRQDNLLTVLNLTTFNNNNHDDIHLKYLYQQIYFSRKIIIGHIAILFTKKQKVIVAEIR